MQETIALTPEMMVVLGLLGFTIFLFVSEIVRVDVAAVSVMVLLGLISMIPGLGGVADTHKLFDGFASNAVISIIAVMIIGAGLDKTGVMSQVASFIMRVGGTTEKRVIPMVSGTVGVISSFMQNVGAAALFLPVISRISARTGLPMSRLLMPMGFCAILGGTMTMVGSSPLILLNDLLPAGMERFELFDVTPIGLALVTTGILYFVLLGKYVLPAVRNDGASGESTVDYFKRVYGLDYTIREYTLPSSHPMSGHTVSDLEREYGINVIGAMVSGDLRVAPWPGYQLNGTARLAVLGRADRLDQFAERAGVKTRGYLDVFSDALSHTKSGIAEVVIPPGSDLIGKTVTEIAMRKTHGLTVLAIHRGEETIREGLRDVPLQAGDTLVCHCSWSALARVEKNRDFVVVTSEYPHEELRPQKVGFAVLFFAIALGLILFTDLRLSVALLVGAVGMILTGVLNMDEAYKAVSWKTVFLLASLIPLGAAVQETGTAAWIAHQTLNLLGDVAPWVLQAAIAILATFFTLVMSNVGATVLLVPLAVSIAFAAQSMGMDADPRVFALTVAIATSNSFLIPTHQVNALIMGPGGYRVKDFMKAGGIMTVLFLVVSLTMLNLIF
ncbi:TrkA-C domain protein [Thioalkalivibrio sulfidiphilus HL-EbGr7]|uniref:TrkA-C domain protein n=1 Tax=Thioalkalivibrio sulfidiphilus (strain HL-EbGR7) TaxID=396588 RepID=B8GQT3_THISH|nr:SLC13 family permease [Thioalkalivibrio sulfidiphilus]ACL74307.1 TrkA-C domain protein [Thioalkalivibrio sulfidiphilus HL-EbGr7]